jgi:hypothetical protein
MRGDEGVIDRTAGPPRRPGSLRPRLAAEEDYAGAMTCRPETCSK